MHTAILVKMNREVDNVDTARQISTEADNAHTAILVKMNREVDSVDTARQISTEVHNVHKECMT